MKAAEAIEILKEDSYVLYEDDSPYNRKAYDLATEALEWFAGWGLTPETANQVLKNYSAFLCSMTGGKLSKIGYDLATMESCARDYWDLWQSENG